MTKHQVDYIENHCRKLSCREIARNVGLTYNAVRTFCLKRNIRFPVFKNNGNIENFHDISDPGVAYLFGFLWADGYLSWTNGKPSAIGIELLREDAIFIEQIFKKLFKIMNLSIEV